ncbi:MAG: ATP-binding protein [Microcystaceae cyanobacterium]
MVVTSLIQVLLIEDNLAEARLIREILKSSQRQKFRLTHCQRLSDALEKLKAEFFDIILLDLTLPDSYGLRSLHPLLAIAPHIPIVVLTNTNDDDLALEAVRQGAQDYLLKRKVQFDTLVRSVCYAIERKQADEELREMNLQLQQRIQQRNEELEKAKEINQLKNEFVSMLSHDFRNPLNTILLSAGLLEDSSEFLSKEQQLSYFKMIRTAIKNMDQILNEVLLIGRADSGRMEYIFEPINLEEFCHSLVDTLQLGASETHPIVFTAQGNVYQGVWDENLLRHILNNLLGNAIKYSPEGGSIYFDLIEKGNYVVMRIKDQGIGIPQASLDLLFKPFYRADNVEEINGTGLGLAIVQRCVEACKGEINVESVVGEGTTFEITFPILTDEMVSCSCN